MLQGLADVVHVSLTPGVVGVFGQTPFMTAGTQFLTASQLVLVAEINYLPMKEA